MVALSILTDRGYKFYTIFRVNYDATLKSKEKLNNVAFFLKKNFFLL